MKQWFRKVWNGLKRIGAAIVRRVKKDFTPAFFVMLGISFIMWYVIKLNYTYTANMPVNVDIDGHQIEVTAVVEGTGHRLNSYRSTARKGINLRWSDVEVTPSVVNPSSVVVSPYSLQNAISARSQDIRVISLGSIPEIEL